MESSSQRSSFEAIANDPVRARYILKGDKIREFIASKKVESWIELSDLRKKIWESEKASKHFQKQRENADSAPNDGNLQVIFLKMMLFVAQDIETATGVFTSVRPKNPGSVLSKPAHALDLCMAPGAFSLYFLLRNPRGRVDGVTLDRESGGHELHLEKAAKFLHYRGDPSESITINWTDITMHSIFLPTGEAIPDNSPDKSVLENNLPLLPHLQSLPANTDKRQYSFIICDGQNLRHHEHANIRPWEPARLLACQLILGLSFIKPGGSMLVLLHNLESWNAFVTVYKFSKFACVKFHKPKRVHAIRSSFYLVATKVQPLFEACTSWVEELKRSWYAMTFGGEAGLGSLVEAGEGLEVQNLLEEWGDTFIELGEEVWRTQRDALKEKAWI
ncbi:hypothetical protein BDZ91DRAFT_716495 [Kalaharituber pfeilii]|nr:hypothetical protein BDZ91DRAFT_716495 [Kalaharituber pfeilii]